MKAIIDRKTAVHESKVLSRENPNDLVILVKFENDPNNYVGLFVQTSIIPVLDVVNYYIKSNPNITKFTIFKKGNTLFRMRLYN